jgi:hypothetical protein
VDWHVAVAWGAVGGFIPGLLAFSGSVLDWQKARHQARSRGSRRLPRLRRYIDPFADVLAALTRVFVGAVAGLAFHTQVTGIVAMILLGAAGPSLLQNFLRDIPSVRAVVQGAGAHQPAPTLARLPGSDSAAADAWPPATTPRAEPQQQEEVSE